SLHSIRLCGGGIGTSLKAVWKETHQECLTCSPVKVCVLPSSYWDGSPIGIQSWFDALPLTDTRSLPMETRTNSFWFRRLHVSERIFERQRGYWRILQVRRCMVTALPVFPLLKKRCGLYPSWRKRAIRTTRVFSQFRILAMGSLTPFPTVTRSQRRRERSGRFRCQRSRFLVCQCRSGEEGIFVYFPTQSCVSS